MLFTIYRSSNSHSITKMNLWQKSRSLWNLRTWRRFVIFFVSLPFFPSSFVMSQQKTTLIYVFWFDSLSLLVVRFFPFVGCARMVCPVRERGTRSVVRADLSCQLYGHQAFARPNLRHRGKYDQRQNTRRHQENFQYRQRFHTRRGSTGTRREQMVRRGIKEWSAAASFFFLSHSQHSTISRINTVAFRCHLVWGDNDESL